MERWLALALLVLAPLVAAAQDTLHDFAGLWFDDASRTDGAWILRARVSGSYSTTQPDAPPVPELAVDFGRAHERVKPARTVTVTNDAAQLVFHTATGWKVALARTAKDRLEGEMSGPDGARHPLHLRRSTLAEVHGWLAQNPPPKVQARRDSTIELLYVSAADCVYCRRWEAQYLENGRPKPSLGWSDVHFIIADIGSYKGRFRQQDAPPHLRPAVERLLAGMERSWLAGTPSYLLFINRSLRSYGSGTTSFETLIHPGLRAALKEKAADAAPR